MRRPNSYELHEFLLIYVGRHDTDHVRVSGSQGQRKTRSDEFNCFSSPEFRNENNRNSF